MRPRHSWVSERIQLISDGFASLIISEEENKKGKNSSHISEGHTALYTYIPCFFFLLDENFSYPIVLNMSFT